MEEMQSKPVHNDHATPLTPVEEQTEFDSPDHGRLPQSSRHLNQIENWRTPPQTAPQTAENSPPSTAGLTSPAHWGPSNKALVTTEAASASSVNPQPRTSQPADSTTEVPAKSKVKDPLHKQPMSSVTNLIGPNPAVSVPETSTKSENPEGELNERASTMADPTGSKPADEILATSTRAETTEPLIAEPLGATESPQSTELTIAQSMGNLLRSDTVEATSTESSSTKVDSSGSNTSDPANRLTELDPIPTESIPLRRFSINPESTRSARSARSARGSALALERELQGSVIDEEEEDDDVREQVQQERVMEYVERQRRRKARGRSRGWWWLCLHGWGCKDLSDSE